MRILHIGDFHYRSNKNIYEQNKVVSQLIAHLQKKEQIDFVLFSGDLVHNGSRKEDFEKAHEALFTPMVNSLKIKGENIFVACGNHDIDRTECSEALINYFCGPDSQIKRNDDLNQWINTNKKDLELSLGPNKNYLQYAIKYFKQNSVTFDGFITVSKRTLENKSIGFVTLNSSWLCSGYQDDKNNLLFPIELLKKAIIEVKDCDLKVIVLHHPLHYFKEFNYIEIQDLIHQEFNLMFSGHIHKEKIETEFNSRNGIYSNTTQATLCSSEGEIGYSILNVNLENLELLKLDRSLYISKQNTFVDLESVVVHIPCGEEKFKQNSLRNKILKKFEVELEASNLLLLNYQEQNTRAFLDTFTNPVLSTRSDADSSSGNPEYVFDFKELVKFENNYLIFGADKCGKTSLLKFIQLYHLKNYSYTGVIPFYIDYKEQNIEVGKFSLKKEISKYYELSKANATEIVDDSKLLILADNLDTTSLFHQLLVSFLEITPNAKFIICSEYIASRVFLEDIGNLNYTKVYFKNLTRKEIRLFTKTYPDIREEDENVVHERITSICSQMQLPLNFWTVSLILLIYRRNNDDYSKNLFSVLDACVDEMLNKKTFIVTKTSMKFEQYKVICSQLAHFLFMKYRETEYSANYSDLITFIRDKIKKNPRVVADERDIFEYLMQSGVLKQKAERYTFRLNGIFEYFLAFYIKDHPEFKDNILVDDSIYLAFKNELELYSGFHRNDSDFLRKIFNKTKQKFDPIIDSFSAAGTIDQNLMRKVSDAHDFGKNIKQILLDAPLRNELADQVADELKPLGTNSDVHVKEAINTDLLDFELLEKYISILSRVFKNLDNVEDNELINQTFSYILDCYANLGFYWIEEFENKAIDENRQNTDIDGDFFIGEAILNLMSKFMPVLIQSMLYEGLGHQNLGRIIDEKIKELRKDPVKNQYKLFLLYFLYIDIDVNAHKGTIDEIFNTITLAPLKVGTLFKLNFYLAFKAYKIPKLEQFFKNTIQKAQLRIDDKTEINAMQKGLANKQKRNIARRNRL